MITSNDSFRTLDIGAYYVLLPNLDESRTNEYIKHFKGTFVEPGFVYNSKTNPDFLSKEDIKELVYTYLKAK